jgi:hypothetical protein
MLLIRKTSLRDSLLRGVRLHRYIGEGMSNLGHAFKSHRLLSLLRFARAIFLGYCAL